MARMYFKKGQKSRYKRFNIKFFRRLSLFFIFITVIQSLYIYDPKIIDKIYLFFNNLL